MPLHSAFIALPIEVTVGNTSAIATSRAHHRVSSGVDCGNDIRSMPPDSVHVWDAKSSFFLCPAMSFSKIKKRTRCLIPRPSILFPRRRSSVAYRLHTHVRGQVAPIGITFAAAHVTHPKAFASGPDCRKGNGGLQKKLPT